MPNVTDTNGVIDCLGGNQKVAEILHTTPAVVSNWRASGRFPAHTYVILQEKLKEMGLTVSDKLWSMRRAPKRKAHKAHKAHKAQPAKRKAKRRAKHK